MSTNKTENYGLHAWVAGDDFLLSEINENFGKLDGGARMLTGTYTGDGTEGRIIALGVTPKAVLVLQGGLLLQQGSYSYGGLALSDMPAGNPTLVEIVEEGFQVLYRNYGGVLASNQGGKLYSYIAFY